MSTTRRPLYLAFEQWPEPDRAARMAATQPGDLLEDGGLGAHWSAGTRTKYAESYGRWLGFLQLRGLLDPTVEPAERVGPALIGEYVRELAADGAHKSIAMRVTDLRCVLRATQPGNDWRWLGAVERRLKARYRRKDAKPPLPVSARQIFERGRREMHLAETVADLSTLKRAVRFRDGLMIALLIARPVRRRNFVGIEIGRHLIKTTGGYLLSFDAGETKTGRPLEYPVPQSLIEPLQRYLETYRPILLGGTVSSNLWITMESKPYTEMGFSGKIRKLTRRVLGEPLRPHAFRHIAATSIATEDPEHARIIASILGHATLTTSDKHYNRARQIDALQTYQRHLTDLRRRLSAE